MHNSIGKTNAPALSPPASSPSVVSPPPVPVAVLQENFFPLNELPRDLKAYIAKRTTPEANKMLRRTNRSFRQAGAESLTKLNIPAQEINKLTQVLVLLPAVTDVTITDLGANPDAYLAALAQLNPAIRSKIRQLDLSERNVTDDGLAHIQSLTQLQSLNLSRCRNLTDAGLAHLKPLTQLQSLNLTSCRNLTDDGLAHLRPLTQLQSLNLYYCRNLTDDGLVHLKPLTQLQSLNLSLLNRLTGAGLAHLKPLTQLQSLNLSYCYNLTDAGLAHLQPLTQLQTLELPGCGGLTDAALRHFPFARL